MMKLQIRFISVLSWTLALLGICYCISNLLNYASSLPTIAWNTLMVARIIGLISISLITAIIISEGWRLLLLGGGVIISYRQSFAILGIAQIGKYLPGNIFHIVGRATMGLRQGIPSATLAVTIWIEAVLILIVAGLFVVVGAVTDLDIRLWLASILPVSSLRFLLLVVGASLLSYVGWLLFGKRLKSLQCYHNSLKPSHLIRVVILYLLIFIVYGCIVKFIPLALWGDGFSMPLGQAIWRFALCWVAGFIVPGAPAGLGVREALFIKLFSPELGQGGAACVALVFRVVTTVGDLITFAVAYWIGTQVLKQDVTSPRKFGNE